MHEKEEKENGMEKEKEDKAEKDKVEESKIEIKWRTTNSGKQ